MKKYTEPKIEVTAFDAEDIITDSAATGNYNTSDDAVITIKRGSYGDME